MQRLLILIRHNGIATLIGNNDGWRSDVVTIDPSIGSTPAKALEEAVYTSPALLAEYSRVDVVADSDRFIIVPSELASDSVAVSNVVQMMWPDASDDDITVDLCGSAAFVSLIDKSLVGFVGRTFMRAAIHHRLAMLASFFMTLSAPVNRVKLYTHFAGASRVDIVAVTSEGLLMANSFDCETTTDAVYYIMACVKDCGFDELEDEMIVCGDQPSCASATEVLRQYINSVMPLLLPVGDANVAFELLNLKK
ncbi:MAG: DUF3822 family protein [Muribaculaceae bacterium]|nr:DUF3822 family protein [Muribaculaceae bacterium]